MAIKKTIYLKSGVKIEDCYLKVVSLSGDQQQVGIVLGAFANKENADNGFPHIDLLEYYFEPNLDENAKEWITQSYNYLKSLEDFSDALDV